MKKKFVLTLAGISVVATIFKAQSLYYEKEINKLQSQLADIQIQKEILQADLNDCKQFKEKSDKLLLDLLKDFEKVRKEVNSHGKH